MIVMNEVKYILTFSFIYLGCQLVDFFQQLCNFTQFCKGVSEVVKIKVVDMEFLDIVF